MFTIVAERINGTRTAIKEATEQRNAAYIRAQAAQQAAAGASYLDVNAGAHPDTEIEDMVWLIEQVQAATSLPISIDSANPWAVHAGLAALDGRPAMINSLSLEPVRRDTLLPLALQYQTTVIGLCLGADGVPQTAEERCALAGELIAHTRDAGISDDRLFIDPLVCCISVESRQGLEVLQAIRLIHQQYPGVHICAGISNVSYGLPQRSLLNRAFLTLAVWAGLDGAIIDPLDKAVLGQLYAARALLGLDDSCRQYLTAACGRLT